MNGDNITVTVNLKNTGDISGDEVVQVYISSNNTEKDRPVKLLKGFKRVGVDAGETKTVEIEAELEDIKFYNPQNESWELDSSYTVYIGTSSKDIIEAGKVDF